MSSQRPSPGLTASERPSSLIAEESSIDEGMLTNLKKAFAGHPGALRSLVEEYSLNVDAQIGEIEAALEAGDPEALEEHAHALKGVSGQLGARLLSVEAGRIEDSAYAKDLGGAREPASRLRRAHAVTSAELLAAVDAPLGEGAARGA